jgi:hypothetical protein
MCGEIVNVVTLIESRNGALNRLCSTALCTSTISPFLLTTSCYNVLGFIHVVQVLLFTRHPAY